MISFLLLPSADSKKIKCFESGTIRIIKNNKQIVLKKSFCIDHPKYDFISLSCIKNLKCQALVKYKHQKELPSLHSVYGSPHHKKCYILGGRPQLIEYNDGKSWRKGGICNFEDLSFISVFNLIE